MITFTPEEKKRLFDGRSVSAVLPYESLESNMHAIREGSGRLSISGAQEKYALVEDEGKLRFTRENEVGTFILKPVSTDRRFLYRMDMPANEHLTMTIAESVYGIPVAAHGLCQFLNGEPAYLTRRFDFKAEGGKYPMEDFASLAGLNRENYGEDFKYTVLSYEDCASLIVKHCLAAKTELLKFFRQILFNYLFDNADAHLKNFSLVAYHPGDYRLSLAYDLLNTGIHLPTSIFALEKGLFKEGTPISDTTPIGRPLFWGFGKRLGFADRLLEKELAFFARTETKTWGLIEGSSLSPEAKTSYLSTYKYRLSTLQ